MSNREEAVMTPSENHRALPVSYREGAVAIPIPQIRSTPATKSPRYAPFQQLFTDPVEQEYAATLPSSKASCRTPPLQSKKTGKSANYKPTSTSKRITVPNPGLAPFSALYQSSLTRDSAEASAAARLESIIPVPFIASVSDARHNVILPPSAPKPNPTRYTILFDAAHTLIMHQSIANGTVQSAQQKKQLEELIRISCRQAKLILQLEEENAKLRGLGEKGRVRAPNANQTPSKPLTTSATPILTGQDRKRKRNEQREKQLAPAYLDGLG